MRRLPDKYVVSLLHFPGANGTTAIVDENPAHTWTAGGNAQIDTAQSKFNGASLLLDGTGDYLSTSDHADFDFGSNNFTIDLWVRYNALSDYGYFYDQHLNNDNRVFFRRDQTSNKLFFFSRSGAVDRGAFTTGNLSPSLNTWYHLAFVRSGSNAYIFVDGVSQTLTTITAWGTIGDIAAGVEIGRGEGTGYYHNGWIDEFRVSKGIARWTSNFTVPAKPYQPGMSLVS